MVKHAKSAIASSSDELFAVGCVAEESRSRGVLNSLARIVAWITLLNLRAGRPRSLAAIVVFYLWYDMPLFQMSQCLESTLADATSTTRSRRVWSVHHFSAVISRA